MPNPGHFHRYVESCRSRSELIVQPRMGFGDFATMRRGLRAVRDLTMPRVGTITVDSFIRTGRIAVASEAVRMGRPLNGYPIAAYPPETNGKLLEATHGPGFPIQVRHGSADPGPIFQAFMAADIEATEGGPVSYCLPYSRAPLPDAIKAWDECSALLASLQARETVPHMETFGGCMMGQLCPPSLLLAVALLEALFFRRRGLASLSLSYAQGCNLDQDVGAILALRRLATAWLPDVTWHVVVYTFMGNFPRTRLGARRLIEDSALLCVQGGAERLLVKTASEALQIPSIADNLEALRWAHEAERACGRPQPSARALEHAKSIASEAQHLVECVLDLHPSLPEALARAFGRGYLDIPFCLHPDNLNRARAWLDRDGTIGWAELGKLPLAGRVETAPRRLPESAADHSVRQMLTFNQKKYDSITHASATG